MRGTHLRAAVKCGAAIRVLICAALCALNGAAAAGDAVLGLKTESQVTITAGLDEPTRKLLERFPENVRNELITALRQGLPLIDQSVHSYITASQDAFNKVVSKSACQIRVLTGDSPGWLADGIWWRLEFKPADRLKSRYLWRQTAFSADTPPLEYETSYMDFELAANEFLCRIDETRSPSSISSVDRWKDDYRWRWRLWFAVADQCSSAAECVTWLKKAALKAIAESPTDASPGASQRVNAIKVPPATDPFRQDPFEQQMKIAWEEMEYVRVSKAARDDQLSRATQQIAQATLLADGAVARRDAGLKRRTTATLRDCLNSSSNLSLAAHRYSGEALVRLDVAEKLLKLSSAEPPIAMAEARKKANNVRLRSGGKDVCACLIWDEAQSRLAGGYAPADPQCTQITIGDLPAPITLLPESMAETCEQK